VVGAALLIAGMWLEIDDGTFWRWTTAASILAVSCGHLSLLSIATLRPAHAWVQLVAYALIFGFAVIVIGIIFSDTGSDWVVRTLAVVGILDAAFTLLVPVVYFLDRRGLPVTITDDAGLAELDAEIARLRSQLAELEARREAWATSHPHNPALQGG
jgi:Zn-dependent protease with chaperone function